MPLIRNRSIADDAWRHARDDEPAPAGERVTVTLARLLNGDGEAAPRGVRIGPDDAVESLPQGRQRRAFRSQSLKAKARARCCKRARRRRSLVLVRWIRHSRQAKPSNLAPRLLTERRNPWGHAVTYKRPAGAHPFNFGGVSWISNSPKSNACSRNWSRALSPTS